MPSLTQVHATNFKSAQFDLEQRVQESRRRHSGVNVIPSDYAELFREYYLYVTLLVRKAGIPKDEAEDVAMSILTTFMERDALREYDPELRVMRGGAERTTLFRTFLGGFVLIYVRHYRERLNVRRSREGLSTETVMFTEAESGHEVTLIDLEAEPVIENYDALMTEDLINDIRQHIATVPNRNANDRMDMPQLFEVILKQIAEHDQIRTQELSDTFGISKASTFKWLRRLRDEISVVVEARAA